jgi:hypothetical protein
LSQWAAEGECVGAQKKRRWMLVSVAPPPHIPA